MQHFNRLKQDFPGLAEPGTFGFHSCYGRLSELYRGFGFIICTRTGGGQGLPYVGGQTAGGFPDALQFILGQLEAELVGGRFFQVVGFVNDDVVVFRNQAAAEGQVGHQQGVVDHDDVGLLGPLAGGAKEAGGAVAHIQAEALFARRDVVPGDGVAAQQVDFSAVAGLGFLKPNGGLGQQLGVVHRQGFGAGQLTPAAEAQIVGPAFELRHLEGAGFKNARFFQDALQGGDVLADKLFLEVDGVGGDDDALSLGHGEEDGRQQVGQRLADASAALDYQVMLVINGVGDCVQHFFLLRAVLEALETLCGVATAVAGGERALGAEHTVKVILPYVLQTFVGAASPYAATGQAFGGVKALGQLGVVQAGRANRRRGCGVGSG